VYMLFNVSDGIGGAGCGTGGGICLVYGSYLMAPRDLSMITGVRWPLA